jgi:tetratricopeptide (TPR) repeat protein
MVEFNEILAAARAQSTAGEQKAALVTLNQARLKYGDDPALLFAMANILRDLGEVAGALEIYRQIEAKTPRDVAVLNNLASALCAQKNFVLAREKIATALVIESSNPDLLITAANIEYAAGDLLVATEILQRGLAQYPAHGKMMLNLAELLADQDDMVGSLHWQQKAQAVLAENPRLQFNMSQTLFKLGRLEEGWKVYDARFRASPGEKPRSQPRVTQQPLWRGEQLTGQKLLIWMEQGVGEEILYAHLLPEAAARCGQLLVECEPRLVALFARSFPAIEFVPRQEPLHPATMAADIAAQIPAASLGQYFRNHWQDFKPHAGYLHVEPKRLATLRANYRALGPGKIIGISWRSRPRTMHDPKSAPLALWRPILSLPDYQFINLQYGDCTDDINFCQTQGWRVHHDHNINPMKNLDDFAAQVAACDHVISVSNTTVHIAGGLGVSCDVLMPAGKDAPHHWFGRRSDSPWYPSLTLWWQSRRGVWDGVLEQVGAKLLSNTTC